MVNMLLITFMMTIITMITIAMMMTIINDDDCRPHICGGWVLPTVTLLPCCQLILHWPYLLLTIQTSRWWWLVVFYICPFLYICPVFLLYLLRVYFIFVWPYLLLTIQTSRWWWLVVFYICPFLYICPVFLLYLLRVYFIFVWPYLLLTIQTSRWWWIIWTWDADVDLFFSFFVLFLGLSNVFLMFLAPSGALIATPTY